MPNRRRSREPSFKNVAHILEKNSCVLCSMLKSFHSACIQNADVNQVQNLCDFHAWTIAGAVDAEAAARILLRLVEQRKLSPEQVATRCSVCKQVAEEETKHFEEFVFLLKVAEFQEWLRDHGALCMPHARRLLNRIPEMDHQVVITLVEQTAARLKTELRFAAENPGHRQSSTVLSRAAEYLKARRGLALDE